MIKNINLYDSYIDYWFHDVGMYGWEVEFMLARKLAT